MEYKILGRLMKYIIMLIAIAMLAGCATCKPCPSQDAYVHDGMGHWVQIPKGELEDPHTDYYTEDDFLKLLEEYMELQREKQEKGDGV